MIVTGFACLNQAIATDVFFDTCRASLRAQVSRLDLAAIGGTSVCACGIAIVARLAELDDAIATDIELRAKLAWGEATKARFHRKAITGATICVLYVTVVTGLIGVDQTVATDAEVDTRGTGDGTRKIALHRGAVCCAAITGGGVAVVTNLGRVEMPVAAVGQVNAILTEGRANISRAKLTGGTAAIVCIGIAVVTGFWRLSQYAVATMRSQGAVVHAAAIGTVVPAVVALFTIVEDTVSAGGIILNDRHQSSTSPAS